MGQRPDDMNPREPRQDVWGPDPVLPESTRSRQPTPDYAAYRPDPADRIVASTSDATRTTPRDDADPDVAELRGEIEQTRNEMSETIDAIQDRLSPQQLADDAKEAATNLVEEAKEAAREAAATLAAELKESAAGMMKDAKESLRAATIGKAEHIMSSFENTARGTSSSMMDTIRENPLPAAMVGLGLGWLFLQRRKQPSTTGYGARSNYGSAYPLGGSASVAHPYADTGSGGGIGETVGAAQERAGEFVGQAKDTAGEIVGQARDTAGNLVSSAGGLVSDASGRAMGLAGSAGSTAKGAGSSLWENIQQNPVPAALAGMSIAWMVRGWDRSSTSNGSYDRGSEPIYAHPGDQFDRSEGKSRFVGQALTQVDQFGREVPSRAQGMLKDKPLVVGALALGLGAAAGLAAPHTGVEREWLGGTRDQLVQQASTALQQTQERMQQVAEGAQQSMQNDQRQTEHQGQSSI